LAKYKHLPIYKLTYDLLDAVTRETRHFPKDFKYSLGTKIRDEAVELVVFIYKANANRENREANVRLILERLQIIELLLRLSKDMRLLSVSAFASLVVLTDDISRQASGWLRSTGRKAESGNG
jgi:hypothetical protein